MSSKKGKRHLGNKHFPVAESVSIALKIQLDKFLSDENETELKFPTFLSAQERGFIHETVAKLGLKSKSRGKGVNRYLTIYKRSGSTIIQSDAKLILDSNMRCTITELLNAFPITAKEKEELSSCPEKERSPQLTHKAMGQLNNGVAQVPNTTYNPDLYKFREKLPVYEQRQDLINAITHNQVIVVSGATGCGKTTQLPQLVLDYCQEHQLPARVYCTQPRRISAVSVAERVAYERMEKIGQSIGYQIRLESRVSPRTVLTYCTNGVLLRTLMAGESALTGVTHIFVDEVHERDKFSDFLLIALRDALPQRKELKLILMSATADTLIFSRYFNNCPVVSIPGRMFEVQRHFLEDVLQMTKYWSRDMQRVDRELRNAKGAPANCPLPDGQKPSEDSTKDIKEDKDPPLDPALQADMDEFLDQCFTEGSLDSFCQILYMYMSEGVSVNAGHAASRRTGLMAAAAAGLPDTLAQILSMGADPAITDKDGKTAYDHAVDSGHAECARLLTGATAAERGGGAGGAGGAPDDDADSYLVEVYQRAAARGEDAVDHELVAALVRHIHGAMPRGAVLVFLPGYDDIVALRELLQARPELAPPRAQLYTLHSNMTTADQRKAFAPAGAARKVVLSTNIAETSVTIDDVVYVVDSCRVKEKYYEAGGGVCALRCGWASRAAAAQRAGRAGRTRAGHAFHLCSRRRLQALPAAPVPEMLRVPLQELCLHTKLLAPPNTPIAEFLARALEPPSFLAVRSAVALLKTIGALTPTEDLTEIGRHLLELTVEPRLGKALLYACVLKCLDPVLTIVCALAGREPFRMAPTAEGRRRGAEARREFAADSHSDHMALLRAFQGWQAARAAGSERAYCARKLLCAATMETVVGGRAQLLAQLRALGLVKARGAGDIKDVNQHSERWCVVKAALVAGLWPSVARVDRDAGALRTRQEARVAFHPSSTLHRAGGGAARRGVRDLPADWVVFEEMSRAGRLCFVRCNTLVTPLTVALFGGPLRLPPGALTQRANAPGLSSDSDSEAEERGAAPEAAALALDEWAAFTADAGDALGVFGLRQKLCALVLRRMAGGPRAPQPPDDHVLAAAVHVLAHEEANAGLSQPPGVGQRPRPLALDAAAWRARLDDEPAPAPAPAALAPAPAPAWRGPRPGDERFLLVKADDALAVEAAQHTGSYPFTPLAANKILKMRQEGARVTVVFAAPGAARLLGAAAVEPASGALDWLATQHLPFHTLRHLSGLLGGAARLAGSRDGSELPPAAAHALLHAFTRRRHPRAIQKHNDS